MMTLPSLATYTSLSRSKLLFTTLPTTLIASRIPTLPGPAVALPQATIYALLLRLRLAVTVAHNVRAAARFLCVGMPMRRMITSSSSITSSSKCLSLGAPSKAYCRAFICGPAFRAISGVVSVSGSISKPTHFKDVDTTQVFVEIIAAPVFEKRLNPSAPTFSPRIPAASPTLRASAPEFVPKPLALKGSLDVNAPAFIPVKPIPSGKRPLSAAASEFVPASCIPPIPARTLSADAPAFAPAMRKTPDTPSLNVSAQEFVPRSKST